MLASVGRKWFYRCVQRIIVITGTDTGVGKTLLTALLAAHLVRKGLKVTALKPISSGNREDARLLRRASNKVLPLDTINPWHFHAPIAPLLAARLERRTVRLRQVLAHIRGVAGSAPHPDYILVEGAGGLLSPLGAGFSTRELIVGLGAEVVIVGANRLGVLNHLRLTVEALPSSFVRKAKIVLMSPVRPDRASRGNIPLLKELVGGMPVTGLPRFIDPDDLDRALTATKVRAVLERLLI